MKCSAAQKTHSGVQQSLRVFVDVLLQRIVRMEDRVCGMAMEPQTSSAAARPVGYHFIDAILSQIIAKHTLLHALKEF